jgi:hypothetical protein
MDGLFFRTLDWFFLKDVGLVFSSGRWIGIFFRMLDWFFLQDVGFQLLGFFKETSEKKEVD